VYYKHVRTALVGLAVATLLVVAPAHAERRVAWDYQRFSVAEGIFTGGLLVGTGAIFAFTHDDPPLWRRALLLDDPVRHASRADTIAGRRRAAFISDSGYYASLVYPLVDVGIAWIGYRQREVAAQMLLIDTEAFALTGFLSFVSNALVRRERPYAHDCTDEERETFPDCHLGGKSESFFSGHTGIAATAAGLTCAHHLNLPLYGAVGDLVACAATITNAVIVGYTRMVADKHYLLDVIAGASVGFLSGFAFAMYHYGSPTTSTTATAISRQTPAVVNIAFGTF
jgi:membrane-associated phospholipid phosphatase